MSIVREDVSVCILDANVYTVQMSIQMRDVYTKWDSEEISDYASKRQKLKIKKKNKFVTSGPVGVGSRLLTFIQCQG
jgi:hypothetical protein